MSKIILTCVCFFICSISLAQNYELDNVSKQELLQKIHPKDSTASAAILFKKARTFFGYNIKSGFYIKTECSIKIKIYKKEGFSWANYEIPYYIGYKNLNDEQVTILKGFTYNIENGKITKQRLTSESKFKTKINEFWETKQVTFPNVREGSILELKYELISENLSEFPVFQYQYKIPVDYALYTTEIPTFYLYQTIKTGYIGISRNDKLQDSTITFENEYNQSKYMSFQQLVSFFEAKDVKSIVEEEYVSSINDIYGKIEHELKTIQYPNEPVKQISTTWESVAKSIYEDNKLREELEKHNYYINDLKNITDKYVSKNDRFVQIYNFIKNKMAWNGKYGYLPLKGLENAYHDSSGNSAEINLILISMLKLAGIDANPILISTKENGVALFPNKSKFNYLIASVELDDKNYLLDATDKNSTIFLIPLRDLNDKGRMIDSNGESKEINLLPKVSSLDAINLLGIIDKSGSISASVKESYFDYCGLKFRDKNLGVSKESIIEKMEKRHKGLEVSEYDLNNTNLSEPIVEKYTVKSDKESEIIGDKMFFSPMLFFAMTENPFKQEKREYPIDFTFPFKEKYMINITIPEGYQLESLPKAIALAMPDKNAAFNYSISFENGQLQLVVTLDINTSIIAPEDYDAIKEFFKIVVDKQNEKVVLKKI